MYSASRASLEAESCSDRPVDSGIGWLLAIERVVSVDGTARHLSNFAGDLEKQKVHRHIGENIGPGEALRYRYRTGIRGRGRPYRASRDVRADVRGCVILVLTEAGCQPEQQQALAGRHAPRLRLQTELVDQQRIASA